MKEIQVFNDGLEDGSGGGQRKSKSLLSPGAPSPAAVRVVSARTLTPAPELINPAPLPGSHADSYRPTLLPNSLWNSS